MLFNQHQPGQLGVNNQANATSNLIKFEKYSLSHYIYPICKNVKAPITLLNQPSEIFKHIPRNFTISTDSGSYVFNIDMLKDTSSVISKYIDENISSTHYHINIKDDDNVMSRIEDMYNGKKVEFKTSELNVLRQITSALNIVCCPKFMKFERFKNQEYTSYEKYENYSVIINTNLLKVFIEQTYPKTFTISTNHSEYKCNKLGIKTSSIINEQLKKNPNLDHYHFDFDDEFNIFQEMCNFFNFLPIEITTDNVHALKKIADDLQINCITGSINNIVESYESSVQKIDEKHILIDTIIDLCNDLYNIKNLGVEKVQEKIIKSVWSSTEENIQELVCYLLQIIQNDFSLHPYILDLLLNLDKYSNEVNELKILLPYFIKQIMFAFPNNKLNCAFVFRLVQKELISIEEVTTKLTNEVKIYNSNKNKGLFAISTRYEKSEKEKFISKLTDVLDFKSEINPINLKNAIVWFFPELLQASDKDVDSMLKKDPFIKKYLPNGIDLFKKMRESYEPDDEISKSISIDDVDTLQKILSQYKSLTNLILYNIFDSISENGKNTLINYAASKGSIKCFKYLLLNHSELDEYSLYYAVLGQNIEIVRIVDQYCSSHNISVEYNFNSDYFSYKGYYYGDYDDDDDDDSKTEIQSPIIPAITNHQNDLFDWILEQKYLKNSLYDVALIAALNGNVHALIQCVNKGFDINSIPTRSICKLIGQSSMYGFNKLTQLIIGLISPKIVDENLHYLLELENFVYCGNISIMKIFFSIRKFEFDIDKGLPIAAAKGYLHIIKDLFETHSDKIGFKEKTAFKSFLVSVQSHQTEVFDYLFKSTVLPHTLSENSLYILLSCFCYLGDFTAVKTFLEFILKTVKNKIDFSESLLYAAISGHAKICQYLIDSKVLINYSNIVSKDYIITCCNKEIFNIIFNSAEPEVKETFVCQLLNESIKNQNLDIVEFLLEKGSPCDQALFEAVSSRNAEIVNIVLKYNSKPSFINKLSMNGTALNQAVVLGDFEIVKLLLSVPYIDPSLYANDNITPLVSAIKSFRLDLINLILDFYGEDIESQTWQLDEALKRILKILSDEEKAIHPYKYNYIPYHPYHPRKEGEEEEEEEEFKEPKAINKSQVVLKILNRLVQIKNINLNCRENKYTLLTFACETNEIDMVSMLVKSGKVNVNSYAPKNGNTPLMIAIENKNIEIAKLLINLPKTNINMRNYSGKTALTIAVEKDLPVIVGLIINDQKFDPDESLLDYAFYISKGSIMKQLYSLNKLDVNYKYIKEKDQNKNEHSYMGFIQYTKKMNHNEENSFVTTLIHAVHERDKEKIDLIIKHPSFDPIKSQIKAALFASANTDDIDIFRLLLSKNNDDVNICSQSQESLLSYSVRCNRDKIVEEIINNKNFDCDKSDILYSFLKTYSINEQQKEKKQNEDSEYDPNTYRIQKILVNASLKSMDLIYKFDENHNHLIDFSSLLPNGKSFFTIMNPNLRNSELVASFMIEHGVDPDKPDKFGQYPLKYLIENDLESAAIVLIRSGKVDLNRKFTLIENNFIVSDSKNATYLHLAACKFSSKILSELLDQDVIDINCKDENEETPLVKAIKYKSIDNIKLLFSMDNLDYKYKINDNYDIIEVAKSVVEYRRNDELHLESKEDYLEYIIHIIEAGKY